MRFHSKTLAAFRVGVLLAASSWITLWLAFGTRTTTFEALGLVVCGATTVYLASLALRVEGGVFWAPLVFAVAYLAVGYDVIIDHALTGRSDTTALVSVGEFLASACVAVFLTSVSVLESSRAG